MLNKMFNIIAQFGRKELLYYIEEHSKCYTKEIDESAILGMAECFLKGGPGSGCRGDNCGRPRNSSVDSNSNEIHRVGDKPVRISEGGPTSTVPTLTEYQPRDPQDMKRDYANAVREQRIAIDNYEANRNTENYHAVNRAAVRLRELEREAREYVRERNRTKPKPKS